MTSSVTVIAVERDDRFFGTVKPFHQNCGYCWLYPGVVQSRNRFGVYAKSIGMFKKLRIVGKPTLIQREVGYK